MKDLNRGAAAGKLVVSSNSSSGESSSTEQAFQELLEDNLLEADEKVVGGGPLEDSTGALIIGKRVRQPEHEQISL